MQCVQRIGGDAADSRLIRLAPVAEHGPDIGYPLQTHEMLFDVHWHAFRVFGGVPGRGIYDNMKTAVDRVGRGKERQINMRFLAMTNHYVYEPEFCNPAAGWDRAIVRH